MQVFEVARKAGETVAKRISSEENAKIGTSQSDRSLLDYVSDYGEGSFLSVKPMGETEDFNATYTHRRPRIVGMLKSAEEEYIKTKGRPQNEQEWQTMKVSTWIKTQHQEGAVISDTLARHFRMMFFIISGPK